MRRWYLPVTVIGISGLGLLFLTDRGRNAMRWVFDNLHRAPDALLEWNEAAQRELDHIQAALNRVAQSLEAAR
ncbi:MAG TPA: hypothetical protein VD837_16220 [Terriglobales bacterium]|nr:hypothetical protein [Terriglobales bacterium]